MDQTDTPTEVASNDQLGLLPERWYCVSRSGMAMLCKDHEDAHANALHCDKAWPAGGPHRASLLVDAAEIARLRHALAQSGKLAEDRLQQMKGDRAQALRWRDQLDLALTVCRCAARVIDSSAYQGVSDEDCDLENAVHNWQALGPNAAANRAAEGGPVERLVMPDSEA